MKRGTSTTIPKIFGCKQEVHSEEKVRGNGPNEQCEKRKRGSSLAVQRMASPPYRTSMLVARKRLPSNLSNNCFPKIALCHGCLPYKPAVSLLGYLCALCQSLSLSAE